MGTEWLKGGSTGALVDVVEMFEDGAAVNLFRVVQEGALVSIGMTRDKGAVSVTITMDGASRREYFHNPDQLTLWSEEAARNLAGSGEPPTPPAGRSRGRKAR